MGVFAIALRYEDHSYNTIKIMEYDHHIYIANEQLRLRYIYYNVYIANMYISRYLEYSRQESKWEYHIYCLTTMPPLGHLNIYTPLPASCIVLMHCSTLLCGNTVYIYIPDSVTVQGEWGRRKCEKVLQNSL